MEPFEIIFHSDDPNSIINSFRPNLTPRQIFLLGSFGGTYWRPIESSITNEKYSNRHKKFEEFGWWNNIPEAYLTTEWNSYDKSINKYKVRCGSTLIEWENSGWINEQDPYGWVEWYCNFYNGRRGDDDERQIKRWLSFCGPNGRFKRRLINMINKKNTTYDDFTISPVIRQSMQHWGYQLCETDINL